MAHGPQSIDAKSGKFDHLPQRSRREVRQVSGEVERKPIRTKPAKRQAADVRDCDDQSTTGRQEVVRAFESRQWIVDVFESMPHRDHIERFRRQFGMRESADDRPNSELRLNAFHRSLRGI